MVKQEKNKQKSTLMREGGGRKRDIQTELENFNTQIALGREREGGGGDRQNSQTLILKDSSVRSRERERGGTDRQTELANFDTQG